ncbi:MAG: HAMP domain-containing protein [Proteobacteria bacterium]|nr:HAMP domain-containing protein [Pseudomonadota bacterium]
MISLSARLTMLYAASFLVASAGMLAIGYAQINAKQVQGLDRLIATERQRIFTHLDLARRPTDPRGLAAGLRKPTDNAAALFRVEVRDLADRPLFRSSNLPSSFGVGPRDPVFANTMLPDGERIRVGRFAHGNVVVLIGTPLTNIAAGMRAYVEASAALLAVMILIGIGLGYLLSQIALRPLRDIAATASRINSNNLSERIPVHRRSDEVDTLARLLNAMLGRIESSFRQIRQFTANASHELKTPLSLVRLHAEAALGEPRLPETTENHIVAQLEQIDQLAAMIDDLLVLARADSSSMSLAVEPIDPATFLDELGGDAAVLAEASGCRVRIDHQGAGKIAFDPLWMRRIVFNLLTNALRASPPGGTVRIRSVLGPRVWQTVVEDEGSGVALDIQHRLFDRFFTASEGGSGLGLAICRSIVELHGGTIVAANRADPGGLSVTVTIPRGESV